MAKMAKAGGFLKKIVGDLIRPARRLGGDAAGEAAERVARETGESVASSAARHADDALPSAGRLADEFGDAIPVPTEGMPVYRVYGEAQDAVGGLQRGSRPFGDSWTPVDPRLSDNFRVDAGLPNENPGRFVVEGRLTDPSAVREARPALPLDGNPGGWPEYLVTNSEDAVDVTGIGGVNEPWTRGPGDWVPPPGGS